MWRGGSPPLVNNEVYVDSLAVTTMRQLKRGGYAVVVGVLAACAVSCATGSDAETLETDSDVQIRHVVVEGGIGGPATRGDWDSATAEPNVLCGLDDVEHGDIRDAHEDAVPDDRWEQAQPDRQGRCGDDYETLLFRLANCEREARDMEPLSCDLRLVWAGREHSLDMRERDYFSHVTPEGMEPGDRLAERGVQWKASAENIAMSPTMALAHTAWMESDGHRRNVLREEVSYVGFGIIETSRGYVMTTLFAGGY